jgi:hypothetical protein
MKPFKAVNVKQDQDVFGRKKFFTVPQSMEDPIKPEDLMRLRYFNANLPPAPTYTELMQPAHNATVNAAWDPWNLAAIIPANTLFVDVVIQINANYGTALSAGIRTNGSGLNRRLNLPAQTQYTCVSWRAVPDSSQIVEIYAQVLAFIDFYLVGYMV